jgi:hypothetical protein
VHALCFPAVLLYQSCNHVVRSEPSYEFLDPISIRMPEWVLLLAFIGQILKCLQEAKQSRAFGFGPESTSAHPGC